jgi:hypothetical protein
MCEFLRRTWVPALLFGIPVLLFDLFVLQTRFLGALPFGVAPLYALVVVMLVWWGSTLRGRIDARRGALSGALCGAALLLPLLIWCVFDLAIHRPAGLGADITTMFISTILILAAPFMAAGAVIGLLAVFVSSPRR